MKIIAYFTDEAASHRPGEIGRCGRRSGKDLRLSAKHVGLCEKDGLTCIGTAGERRGEEQRICRKTIPDEKE